MHIALHYTAQTYSSVYYACKYIIGRCIWCLGAQHVDSMTITAVKHWQQLHKAAAETECCWAGQQSNVCDDQQIKVNMLQKNANP